MAFSQNPFSPTSTNDQMNRLIKSLALSFTFTCFAVIADDNVTTKHTLTLEGARKAGEAAAAFAKQNGANPAIAVVDEGGHLLYFLRLEGAFTASPNISIGKAKTAALFRKPTSDFENIVNKGRFAMTALPPDFTPLQGGVPIKHGEHVIGAIGVSGAKSAAQDEEVANAGARVVELTSTAQK
jgi:glc operon protein GlcG